jgi:hypothetical protein
VIVSSEGYEHQAATELEVRSSKSSASYTSSGSTSSGSGIYCGDGICTGAVHENCNNCPQDCGACPPEQETSSEPAQEESIVPESSPRTPEGVGSASALFRKVAANPVSWLLFLAVITALYIVSSRKKIITSVKTFKSKKKKVNWEGYFNRNN